MATVKPAVKPSTTFINTFNKLKKNGLTESEQSKLTSIASKEIQKSSDPLALAAVYTKEVKGWVAKGLAPKHGTTEMATWEFRTRAEIKLGNDAAKWLKANEQMLVVNNPSLSSIHFPLIERTDFGEFTYVNVTDKRGVELKDTDARVKLLKKLLGDKFKSLSFGLPSGLF